MSRVSETVHDFDAAFERLQSARSTDEQRRAVTEAVDRLYELRAYREKQAATKNDYRAVADQSTSGQVTEGLLTARGVRVHDITRDLTPTEQTSYPSPSLYPSEYVYPGSNLCWLRPEHMASETRTAMEHHQKTFPYYRQHLAGHPVLPSLAVARIFLVEQGHLGPL